MGVSGQRRAPTVLPSWKTRYQLYGRLGGTQGAVWTGAEKLVATEFRSPERPTHTESLYRLSYRGPRIMII